MRFIFQALVAAAALASSGEIPAQTVPIREIGKTEAVAAQHFGLILNVRALPNGNVLVNDGSNLKVFLLDSMLLNARIVVGDETQVYGPRAAPLLPYLNDSTIFIDRIARSLVMLDMGGKVARVFSLPRPSDLPALANASSGVDAAGNLIYLGFYRSGAIGKDGKAVPPTKPDFAPMVRANFDKRSVDTLAHVRVQPLIAFEELKDAAGKVKQVATLNPWLEVDDWAVMSDGTIAIVDGHDYHVQFVRQNGVVHHGPRLPIDLKPLSDADKRQLVDSAAAADAKRALALPSAGPRVNTFVTQYINWKHLPDYLPTIRPGAAKPDADNNLWVLPNTSRRSIKGELVYDVINSDGVLIYCVRLPLNKAIAGFGPRGTVYLMTRESDGWVLEKGRVMLPSPR